MKTEDIDKKIGMPDVDKEWARFEQEVIGKETKRHSALAWALGIGIAASVALLIIYKGKEQTEQPLVAQVQPAQPELVSKPARVPAKEVVAEVSKPVATPRKELALAKADAPATTGLDIPAREYTGAVQKFKMDDIEDLAFESVDQALQGQIAERDIASADLGSGTTMRLRGIGDNKIDSFLVVVNGKTLFDSRGMTSEETERRLEEYLNEQGLLQDIKIPWKNGAIEIYASTPEEREERQRMIANATIVPNPSYFGSNSMRLHGTGDYRPSDKDRMDSTLILINGEPLPDSLKQRIMGDDMDDIDTYMPRYFSQQGLMIDSVYVHKDSEFTAKYGGLAKYGVIEIKAVPYEYGQIAGLPPIDIRRVKNDYRRTVNKQAPDTILTLVNGKEDEAFLPYLRKNPYWSRTFIYDYFFERNQLFIRQYRPEGDEINKYAHLFNGRDIRFILDYQSMPYKPVGQFTPDELKARRLAYLLRCYREGKNNQDNHGMLAPDLFDTPAEERLFGLLGVKYWQGNRFERFGHVSRDSRGTYIPLERHMQFKVQDQIWEENGEWLGMEDDERFNAVIKDLDEAANGASSSLVEPGDSVVAMAFIYGGKVAKGALHESDVMWEKPFKDKVKGSIFEFTPDEDAPSYWTAEIYYSTQFPRHMVVYLNSVDKLYATECPDILNIHYKHLTGVVQDEEGKPVSGALVSYRDRPYFSDGVATDSLGRFELMLPSHIDTIRASWVGYQSQKIRVLPTDSVLTIHMKEIDWKGLRKSEEKSLSSWKILLNSVSLQHKKKASEE